MIYNLVAKISLLLISPWSAESNQVVLNSNFELSSDSTCINQSITASYTGTASNNAIFSWSFSGGVIESGSPNGPGPIEVSWTTSGSKTVSLQVLENNISFEQVSKTVAVGDTYLEELPAATICAGDSAAFRGRFVKEPGIYRDTLTTIYQCDSIISFELTVLDHPTSLLDTAICQGDSVLFNGIYYTESGLYQDTIATEALCDSVAQLQLTVFPVEIVDINTFICAGDSFQLGNQFIKTPGTYLDTLTSVNNCDSIVNLSLDVIQPISFQFSESVCIGDTVVFGERKLTRTGIYRDTLTSQSGCDSTVTLDLLVSPIRFTSVDTFFCAGDSIFLAGQFWKEQVLIEDTLQTVNGCDSIVTTIVRVIEPELIEQTVNICEGSSYVFDGQELSEPGIYTDTSKNLLGCDSITRLNLVVNSPKLTITRPFLCEGDTLIYRDTFYTEAGIYRDTFLAANGCDSVLEMRLDVFQQYYEYQDSICSGDTLVFGPKLITLPGLYRDTFNSVGPCDSIVSIQVSIVDEFNLFETIQICEGDTISLNGQMVTDTGIYRDTLQENGCTTYFEWHVIDQPPILDTFGISICQGQSFVFNERVLATSGYYFDTLQTAELCDSISTLHLTVIEPAETTIQQRICEGAFAFFDNQILRETGIYYDTLISLSTGCDSIVALDLIVISPVIDTVNQAICPGDEFDFNNNLLSNPGTYVDTLISSEQCDSIVYLILSHLAADTTDLTATICVGDSIQFNQQVIKTAGIFTDTLTGTDNCDSIIILEVKIEEELRNTILDTLCLGDTLVFADLQLFETGNYFDTLSSQFGCDSIVELQLFVQDYFEENLQVEICEGESYLFNDTLRTTPGIYRDTIITMGECDTVKTLNLILHPTLRDTMKETICANGSLMFAGELVETPGIYADTLISTNGCDSISVLVLDTLPVRRTMIVETICSQDSILFNDRYVQLPGSYTDTLTGINSCDSIVTLVLENHPDQSISQDTIICSNSSIAFGGQMINTAGIYRDTTLDGNQCPLITMLNVQVNPVFDTLWNTTICTGDTLLVGDSILSTAGSYFFSFSTVQGCDSNITVDLDVQNEIIAQLDTTICSGDSLEVGDQTFLEAGSYEVRFSRPGLCDSVLQVNLSLWPTVSDTVKIQRCEDDLFSVGDSTLFSSGLYTFPTIDTNNCNQVIVYDVAYEMQDTISMMAALCIGDSLVVGDSILREPGQYFLSKQGSGICDTILAINISQEIGFDTTLNHSICQGDTLFIEGDTITQEGLYPFSYQTTEGCDSIVNVNVQVFNRIVENRSATICANQTFNFGNRALSTTGIYRDSFTSETGCDSLIILELTVNPIGVDTINAQVCPGGTYQVGAQTFDQPGQYDMRLPGAALNGCDSMIHLSLSFGSKVFQNIAATLCPEESYNFGDQTLTAPGIYTRSLPATMGCDSVIILDLSYHPIIQDTLYQTICQGDSIQFGDTFQKMSGTYTFETTNAIGCDSIITLKLDVVDTLQTALDVMICRGDTYQFGNQQLTQSGTYVQSLTSVSGCDSLVNLNLAVVDTLRSEQFVTWCEGQAYEFGGTSITSSGYYESMFSSTGSCDSIVGLWIEFLIPDTTKLEETICAGSFTTLGTTPISSAGVYSETYINEAGCDSTVVLTVNIDDEIRTVEQFDLCAGDSIIFNGRTYKMAGTFIDTIPYDVGCFEIVEVTINEVSGPVFEERDTSICPGEMIVFGERVIEGPGSYIDTVGVYCDTIIRLNVNEYTLPNAVIGADQLICEDGLGLQGNQPQGTTGSWSTSGNGNFSAPQNATTTFQNIGFGMNQVFWTLSTEQCPDYSTDTISVNYLGFAPDAVQDRYLPDDVENQFSGNVLENDDFNGLADVVVSLVNASELEQVSLAQDGSFTYSWPNFPVPIQFTYLLENESCPMFFDTATVTIAFSSIGADTPNKLGITPNGDGVNEYLVIPELETAPQLYPENELIIVDRWGDVVFQAKPYENDWDGKNERGKVLPAGTYYYYLKLDASQGLEQRGVVVILR